MRRFEGRRLAVLQEIEELKDKLAHMDVTIAEKRGSKEEAWCCVIYSLCLSTISLWLGNMVTLDGHETRQSRTRRGTNSGDCGEQAD